LIEGGYYLIGMKRPVESLFLDIAGSCPNTLEVIPEMAKEEGVSVGLPGCLLTLTALMTISGLKKTGASGFMREGVWSSLIKKAWA